MRRCEGNKEEGTQVNLLSEMSASWLFENCWKEPHTLEESSNLVMPVGCASQVTW